MVVRELAEAVIGPETLDTLDAPDAADGVVVVSNVVPQGREIRGRDGLHPELLHRPHLDEELVDQQPQEDEEDAANLKSRPCHVSRFAGKE